MGATTEISWAHSTFNPWMGCTKVGGACRNCYAERDTKRFGRVVWGPTAERVVTSDENWKKPLAWDRAARAAGERRRVFCASLADVFEGRPDLDAPRKRLWDLIERTASLDWLLLTKRPQNVAKMVPASWLVNWPPYAWVGASVENRAAMVDRVPHLIQVPAKVRFLSVEPMLEDLRDLPRFFWFSAGSTSGPYKDVLGRVRIKGGGPGGQMSSRTPSRDIAWVIVGGESGPGARILEPDWVRDLRDQCVEAGVPFHFKQWGEVVHSSQMPEQTWLEVDAALNLPSAPGFYRVGKKRAGRLLDGRTWDEFPEGVRP